MQNSGREAERSDRQVAKFSFPGTHSLYLRNIATAYHFKKLFELLLGLVLNGSLKESFFFFLSFLLFLVTHTRFYNICLNRTHFPFLSSNKKVPIDVS